MDKIISCEFNIDTACVEVKYANGSMISIDCTRVENEVARNMYEASELDWLVYNAPVDYVNFLLHGDIREYLRNTPDYHPLDNWYDCGAADFGGTAFRYLNGEIQYWINQYWKNAHN